MTKAESSRRLGRLTVRSSRYIVLDRKSIPIVALGAERINPERELISEGCKILELFFIVGNFLWDPTGLNLDWLLNNAVNNVKEVSQLC